MMQPQRPESLESLRGRWRRAVSETYKISEIRSGEIVRPSILPEHIFDFEDDGLRLIASIEVDDVQGGGRILHVSVSNLPPDVESRVKEARSIEPAVEYVSKRVADLSGEKSAVKGAMLSPGKGILHVIFEPPNNQ